MTTYGPASTFLIVGDMDVSDSAFQASIQDENVIEETHPFGATMDEYLPAGLGRVMLEAAGGLYESTLVDALQAMGETLQLVTFGIEGEDIGDECSILNGTYVSTWSRKAEKAGLTKADAKHTITGDLKLARILHDATVAADGNTEATPVDQLAAQRLPHVHITSSSVANPSVILCVTDHGLITGDEVVISGHVGSTPDINGQHIVTMIDGDQFSIPVNVTVAGAGGIFNKVTSTGATVQLHVTALTLGGYTDLLVKVRHSADNIVYADLVAFSATAVTVAERKTVAGEVNRYTAVSWDFEGAGAGPSATFVAAISR